MAGGQGFVAVVGARVLPAAAAPQVADVVQGFLSRGWGIGSGGARGADAYALNAVVAAGPAACVRSVVFLPGAVPTGAEALDAFVGQGGRVVPGVGGGRVALLRRSRRLARASAGVVAFLWGPSRGSVFTAREVIRAGKPAAVVLAGGGAILPVFGGGRWVPCCFGSVPAFRWHPEPRDPSRPSWLARVFQVPAGEPTHAQLAHIAGLSAGERLWFERGVLAGDTVLVAHEALSDTPAYLATRGLMRRFRCDVREAAGLAELFLALDAGPGVVAHYEHEARGVGVTTIIADLVHLVAGLALAEQAPETDALEHADALGDGVEWVDDSGHVAQAAMQPQAEAAPLAVQWHALGTVQPEHVTCPVCGAQAESDPDASDLPTCAECGTRDTWEARQGGRFRGIVGAIDTCPSLEALGGLGKRLYAVGFQEYGTRAVQKHGTPGAVPSRDELGSTPAGGAGRRMVVGQDRGVVQLLSPLASGEATGRIAFIRHEDVWVPPRRRGRRAACGGPGRVAARLGAFAGARAPDTSTGAR